jgi:AraC-like DNA-binding protein
MGYREFLPHPSLRPYIDAYWTVESEDRYPTTHRIYPDGCIDIIINLGEDFSTDSHQFTMKTGGIYLVGTMTRYKDTVRQPGSSLLGIRFKPLGFPSFYKFHSLHEIKDDTVEFDPRLVPEIHELVRDPFPTLDKFFHKKLNTHPQRLNHLLNDMSSRKGNFSIEALAKDHSVTTRQLERNFKNYIGVSPKEYANFLRYRNAAHLIANSTGKNDLLDVALVAGYYDHAHMTNEIRRYTGVAPSHL